MTTTFFPKNVPSARRLGPLLTTRLTARSTPPEDNDKGWTCELRSAQEDRARDAQITLPQHYYDHIRRFAWRWEVLSLVLQFAEQLDAPSAVLRHLQMMLVYMEAIQGELEKEAKAVKRDERTGDWRCRILDLYLITEYCAHRHDPYHVREYRRHGDVNINRIDADKLGETRIQLS